MLMLNVATAQDCPFRVKFEVIPATCYNNGMVTYAMTNSAGEVITSAGSFTEVRAYYIEQGDTAKHYSGRYLVNASGDMVYPNGWDTLTVDYGTYTIVHFQHLVQKPLSLVSQVQAQLLPSLVLVQFLVLNLLILQLLLQ